MRAWRVIVDDPTADCVYDFMVQAETAEDAGMEGARRAIRSDSRMAGKPGYPIPTSEERIAAAQDDDLVRAIARWATVRRGKYGRIFTEADMVATLRAIAGQKGNENVADYAGVMADRVGELKSTFGDEPVFVIRAKDRAAGGALDSYREWAEGLGASLEFLDSVIVATREIADWQADHDDLVKVPD